ncbi:MAG: hypothetical protein V5A62_14585 [Haloarculaceae archaeon]
MDPMSEASTTAIPDGFAGPILDTLDDTAPVRLSGVVEGCWTNIETDGATLRVETDRVVMADASRLRQVL